MKRWLLWIVLLGLVGMSVLGPKIAPYGPLDEAGASLQPPDWQHPFGTDLAGRDVWSRVLNGAGRTLLIAALATACAALPGTALGLSAGYLGGWLDSALMLLTDALLAVPSLLVAMCVIALTGYGPGQIALATGIAGLPPYIRIARATAQNVRHQLYIEAARSLGARTPGIIVRHILPNARRPLIAFGLVTLSWAILNSAALHFLGFGGDPSLPEWGAMLADARQVYRIAPWVALGPGLALMLTLAGINLWRTAD